MGMIPYREMTVPELLKALLPPGYVSCVAGGFAADPARAGDIDVWVMEPNGVGARLPSMRADILNHLYTGGWTFEPLVEKTQEFASPEDVRYYGMVIDIEKVARVSLPGYTQTVHIMVTDAMTIPQVLAGFDISTHQVAIDQRGEKVYGPDWTPTNVTPQIIRDTPSTPGRLERITKRYADLVAAQDALEVA